MLWILGKLGYYTAKNVIHSTLMCITELQATRYVHYGVFMVSANLTPDLRQILRKLINLFSSQLHFQNFTETLVTMDIFYFHQKVSAFYFAMIPTLLKEPRPLSLYPTWKNSSPHRETLLLSAVDFQLTHRPHHIQLWTVDFQLTHCPHHIQKPFTLNCRFPAALSSFIACAWNFFYVSLPFHCCS